MKYLFAKKSLQQLMIVLGLLAGTATMTACTDEDPFEEAGEELDNAIDEID